MDDKYISVEAFTASVQERYCKNCDRRKGMKNGKLKTVYAIGDAPCRACGIDDMVGDIDDYPPADVVARDCFNRILAENDTMREQLAAIGKKPGDKMDDVLTVVVGHLEEPNEETERAMKVAERFIHADITAARRAGKGHIDIALRQTPDGKAEMRVMSAIAETEGT